MDTSVRFVHTADWQLGLRAGHIPDDDGAAVRNARFEVIGRIADVARDADAQFVVVAGDVFEHHALQLETTQRTFEALRAFRCPVYLLPGNHDPYTPDALYRTDWWQRECPSGVRVLSKREIEPVANAILLPCPLTERDMHNPAAWLDARPGPADTIRIGIAHGAVPEALAGRVEADRVINDIPKNLTDRAGLDYLALGDWHGRRQINDRTWYSGTPEATGFTERDTGNVLLVSVDRPRAPAQVESVRVARYEWQTLERTLMNADDVAMLERELDAMPSRSTTLLELVLIGSLSMALHATVSTTWPARYRGVYRHLRMRTDGLQLQLSEEDYSSLPREGWIGRVVQRLRDGDGPEHQRALQLLHRIHVGLSHSGQR